MVAIKKFWSSKKKTPNIKGRSTMRSNTFATLLFAEVLRLLAYQLKDCINGQDNEKEETPMTGNRNGLLQSC